MPFESCLWCLTLTDEERAIAGIKLAAALGIDLNAEGLVPAATGALSTADFFNSVNNWVFQFADEAAEESREYISPKVVPLFPQT